MFLYAQYNRYLLSNITKPIGLLSSNHLTNPLHIFTRIYPQKPFFYLRSSFAVVLDPNQNHIQNASSIAKTMSCPKCNNAGRAHRHRTHLTSPHTRSAQKKAAYITKTKNDPFYGTNHHAFYERRSTA